MEGRCWTDRLRLRARRDKEVQQQKVAIGGIIQNRNLVKIGVMSIPDRPGVAAAIFGALGTRGVNCPFIVHTIDLNGQDSILLCVDRKRLKTALRALDTVKDEVGAKEVVYHKGVGVISVYGPHFSERSGVAGVMFSALAAANINILAISTSISSLSCVLDECDIDEGVKALEQAFDLP
jgi:aspartokinase